MTTKTSFLKLAIFPISSFIILNAFKPIHNIYHEGWIDFNKNGKKDIYEDPKSSIENRVNNLLSQMSLNEKTNQLVTLYGWHRILKDSLPTPQWKNEIWKDGIANIDEHLNGFINWGHTEKELDLVTDIKRHVYGMNETQRFFVEETRLGIPVDFTNEGIRGIEAYKATGFPTQLNMGMTWDTTLVHEMGLITGSEARALGYTNVYSPVMDVARDQRWGRLEESYGESPYLVARLGVQMIKGIQHNNQCASTVKHFAVYSANKGAREGLARTDPQVSPREVEDVMLYPFKRIFAETDVMGVMCSYNDYNGIPIASSDSWLIQRLRKEMGFKGYIVSDSDALEYLYNKHHVASSLKDAVKQAYMAGLDVRTTFDRPDSIIIYLRELVQEGSIPKQVIDERVRDVLRVKFRLGLFDQPYVSDAKKSEVLVNSQESQHIALKSSRESIVLLKNTNNILPLSKNIGKVAVIGPNVLDDDYAHTHYGPLESPSINMLSGIEQKVGLAQIGYARGCDLVDSHWPESEILPQPMTTAEKATLDSAVDLTQKSDIAIVYLGGNTQTAGENKSRTSLDLPGFQLDLIKAIKATGKKVVVVLVGSQPMTINWIDKYVDAIVYVGYPGVKGGLAVADVLFGDYIPGGKLTLTWPKSIGQLPLNFPTKPNAQTDKGELAKIKGILYPFGYGLSYTTFKYSNLKLKTKQDNHQEGNVQVSMDITNTGKYDGDEVVQIYVRDVLSSVTTYEKRLVAFARRHVKVGETQNIDFTIHAEDLKLWNRNMKHIVEPGEFIVMVGSSSENIKLTKNFTWN